MKVKKKRAITCIWVTLNPECLKYILASRGEQVQVIMNNNSTANQEIFDSAIFYKFYPL